jgi:hypothetical protein
MERRTKKLKRRMIGAWMALMITASSLVVSASPAADMSSVSAVNMAVRNMLPSLKLTNLEVGTSMIKMIIQQKY